MTHNNSSSDNRTVRLAGRAALRLVTSNKRCLDCGRVSVLGGGIVGVRKKTSGPAAGAVGFAGLASCGSSLLCPVCNAKVMQERAQEMGGVLTWATVEGFIAIWGSLTLRHNRRSSLGLLLDFQTRAWDKLVSSRWWRDANAVDAVPHEHVAACAIVAGIEGCTRQSDYVLSKRSGRVGYIRASEITVGANGWHPHYHPIVIFQGTPKEAQAFAREMKRRWVAAVLKVGGQASGFGAQSLEVVDYGDGFRQLAAYVTKATYEPAKLALEAVWSQSKDGKNRAWERVDADGIPVAKTVSHWALLAEIEQGLADAVEQWQELEDVSKNYRLVTWSRGLRQLAGFTAPELTEDEIAAREVGVVEDTVCIITGRGWRSCRDNPYLLGLILSTLQASGWAGLRPVLDGFGVEWVTLEDLAQQSDSANADFADDMRDAEYSAYWSNVGASV